MTTMRTLTTAAALLLAGAAIPDPAPAQLLGSGGHRWGPEVQLWLEGGRDSFSPGDPLRLRFRAGERAWVAVIHIDPAGRLDFLLPAGPGEDNYVFPGRTYALPRGSATSAWRLGPAQGIGYFFVVAAREPLDLRRFRRGGQFAGGQVRGDPFLVMQEVAEALRPRAGEHTMEALSYRVGSGHSWPSYACWERTPRSGTFLIDAGYLRCDRLPMLLALESRYYDPVRYRGDRARHFRRVAAPTHGSKHGGAGATAPRSTAAAPPPAPPAAREPAREPPPPRARPGAEESAPQGGESGRARPTPP